MAGGAKILRGLQDALDGNYSRVYFADADMACDCPRCGQHHILDQDADEWPVRCRRCEVEFQFLKTAKRLT